MIQSGLKPIRPDKRDYDHHKTFGFAGMQTLPLSFDVDANLWCPDQNAANYSFTPPIPNLPYGCTDYTQSDLCTDEDGVIRNPMDLENITHANAKGGADIRTALEAAKQAFGRTAYFSVKAYGLLDWFDSMRVAMFSTQTEKRSVSIGIPWFPEFESPDEHGVLPMPKDFDIQRASWHNAKVSGWSQINGILYLKCKSWQGEHYALNGYCYISRELINNLMSIHGTGAFTITKTTPSTIQTVDWNIVKTIVSFIRSLLGYYS